MCGSRTSSQRLCLGGEKRVARSGVIRLEVAGAPLVSRTVQEVVAVSGRDVSLEAEFCSDPLPLRNTWQWGSVVLPAGSELGGKYRAEMVEHPQVYIAQPAKGQYSLLATMRIPYVGGWLTS
jgi:hypothetical protein